MKFVFAMNLNQPMKIAKKGNSMSLSLIETIDTVSIDGCELTKIPLQTKFPSISWDFHETLVTNLQRLGQGNVFTHVSLFTGGVCV